MKILFIILLAVIVGVVVHVGMSSSSRVQMECSSSREMVKVTFLSNACARVEGEVVPLRTGSDGMNLRRRIARYRSVLFCGLENTDINSFNKIFDPSHYDDEVLVDAGMPMCWIEDGKGRTHPLKTEGRCCDSSYAGFDRDDLARQTHFQCLVHGRSKLLTPGPFTVEACENSYLEIGCDLQDVAVPASGALVKEVMTDYFDFAPPKSDVYLSVLY